MHQHRGGCLDYDPNLVLKPGEKQRLYTVVPHDKSKTYRYHWRAWSGEERPAVVEPPMPRPQPQQGKTAPNVGAPTPSTMSSRPRTDTPPAPGVDPSGAVSNAVGNPLDTKGATIHITATNPGERSVRSLVPPAKFRTRRMRLSSDIDAQDVFGGVTLWIQVTSPGGDVTAESSAATRISGTKKGHLSVTMTIPSDATALTLALKLQGTGTVTATSFIFREVVSAPQRGKQ